LASDLDDDAQEEELLEASRDSKVLVQGLVIKSTPLHIEVVFDCSIQRFVNLSKGMFMIGKHNSRIPFDRTQKLLSLLPHLKLQKYSLYNKLLRNFSDEQMEQSYTGVSPEVLFKPLLSDPKWMAYQALNESQKTAVKGALLCDSHYMIHGPPGTGKSETLVVLLEALVRQNMRVLICSEANNPVDNLLTKFSKTKYYKHHHDNKDNSRLLLRLGNSWLVEPACRKYTLTKLVQDKIKHIKSTQKGIDSKISKGRLDELITGIMEKSQLIFTTQCSLYRKIVFDHFSKQQNLFDYAIVDEASQSFIAFALMAVSCSKKIIFAGDHLQLPPVILSNMLKEKLEVSLFERLINHQNLHPPQTPVYSMLDTQYKQAHTSERSFSLSSSELDPY